ncbi:MAG: sugar kinase, partial [Candidatus Diapherotrites archaeon]|nr:sugar kinase [Candidatus Diapherotrites archaeon]
MAELLTVGSIGFDSVRTPFGRATRVIGGSAAYSAIAASFFISTSMVSAVGRDFSRKHQSVFEDRGIDTSGIFMYPSQKTLTWRAHYGFDINDAKTDKISLNAFGSFVPNLSEDQKRIPFLFLANGDPQVQLNV